MNTVIQLNEGWAVTGTYPDHKLVGPIKASVPGHVHTDLLREGLIPDPFWRDQALESQWVESCDWLYETTFIWPEEADGAKARAVFEGLDTVAVVKVNGVEIGRSSNMFIPYAFSLGHCIKPGLNHIQVKFQSLPETLQGKEASRYHSLFSEDRVFVRRMQCTFGWDWVHRLVSFGIWREARIECLANGKIEYPSIRSQIHPGQAKISIEVQLTQAVIAGHLQLRLYSPDGELAHERIVQVNDPSTGIVKAECIVADPELWWPIGYGNQPLYELETVWLGQGGEVWDVRRESFGIRHVQVEQIPDERGSSFTIVINGVRIFAKGGNWVPADPFPSTVTSERYEQLLKLLTDGNMNMLRVWGGGIYELPAFWEACDRLGIMISLDFMMACAQYPEDEEWFLAEMCSEIAHAIKSLRNHPSLIIWYGDNELAMNNNEEDDYPGKQVCALVTAPLCDALDPDRPFFPTSPYLGSPFNSPDAGDCHVSAWYDSDFMMSDMADYRSRIAAGQGRFLSESAIMGSPPMHALLRMMSMEDVEDENAYIWEFRTKDNPYNGQDELTHYRLLEKTARQLYGVPASTALRIKQMEYAQYDFAKLKAEHYRRQKFSSSGVLYWMYNDCWPASGWSLVDYFGGPKAGYFGAKKGFKPLHVCFEDRGEHLAIWLLNDSGQERGGKLTLTSFQTDAKCETVVVADRALAVGSNVSCEALCLSKSLLGIGRDGRTVCRVLFEPDSVQGGDNEPGVNMYFDALSKDLPLSMAELSVQWHPTESHAGELVITSDVYAHVVTIDEDLIAEDNYFDLAPGEIRRIRYQIRPGTPALSRAPKITCWNNLRNNERSAQAE